MLLLSAWMDPWKSERGRQLHYPRQRGVLKTWANITCLHRIHGDKNHYLPTKPSCQCVWKFWNRIVRLSIREVCKLHYSTDLQADLCISNQDGAWSNVMAILDYTRSVLYPFRSGPSQRTYFSPSRGSYVSGFGLLWCRKLKSSALNSIYVKGRGESIGAFSLNSKQSQDTHRKENYCKSPEQLKASLRGCWRSSLRCTRRFIKY